MSNLPDRFDSPRYPEPERPGINWPAIAVMVLIVVSEVGAGWLALWWLGLI